MVILFILGALFVTFMITSAQTGIAYGLQFRRHTKKVQDENKRARMEAKASKKAGRAS